MSLYHIHAWYLRRSEKNAGSLKLEFGIVLNHYYVVPHQLCIYGYLGSQNSVGFLGAGLIGSCQPANTGPES